jgi:regulatory protein
MRPHSAKEVRDYLYRKTRPVRNKTGEMRDGVSPDVTVRVFDRLVEKNYINDENFARYWVENRSLAKGASKRKLTAELRTKGVEQSIIEQLLSESDRTDEDEIQKVIAKKRSKYPDNQKLMSYLARQGFSYDDIKSALAA